MDRLGAPIGPASRQGAAEVSLSEVGGSKRPRRNFWATGRSAAPKWARHRTTRRGPAAGNKRLTCASMPARLPARLKCLHARVLMCPDTTVGAGRVEAVGGQQGHAWEDHGSDEASPHALAGKSHHRWAERGARQQELQGHSEGRGCSPGVRGGAGSRAGLGSPALHSGAPQAPAAGPIHVDGLPGTLHYSWVRFEVAGKR